MSHSEKDVIESILGNSFRFSTVFGLSTHLYDRDAGKLVFSRGAFGYSLALHLSQVLLSPSVYRLAQSRRFGEKAKRDFLNQLLLCITFVNFVSIGVSIVRQWTTRARESKLFNEIIRMWYKDMSGFSSNAKIRRDGGRDFISVTIVTLLHIAGVVVSTFCNMDSSLLSLACGVYACSLISIIIVVEYQFCQGMVFGAYLFQILNHNLTRVVTDISGLRDSRRRAHRLSRELLEIGGLHKRLQRWIVRFKDTYQVELVFNMMVYFVTQVSIFFISTLMLRKEAAVYDFSEFLPVAVTTIVGIVDMWNIFYTCDCVIESCNAAGGIMKDLTKVKELPSRSLERAIELTCFELKRERIRLSICGLTDIAWRTGFAVTEAAMMHIILLVQIDYENF